MKAAWVTLACLAIWLLIDRPFAEEETPLHWCVHELHRAIGKFFSLQTS